jgi:hypothetical protein
MLTVSDKRVLVDGSVVFEESEAVLDALLLGDYLVCCGNAKRVVVVQRSSGSVLHSLPCKRKVLT